MAASDVFLPRILEEEAEALVKKGYYSSRSELFKDALRVLMQNKADLRIISAIEMFKEKKASLEKAAELAGVSVIEFKDILADRGVTREIGSERKEELKRRTKRLKELKKCL